MYILCIFNAIATEFSLTLQTLAANTDSPKT